MIEPQKVMAYVSDALLDCWSTAIKVGMWSWFVRVNWRRAFGYGRSATSTTWQMARAARGHWGAGWSWSRVVVGGSIRWRLADGKTQRIWKNLSIDRKSVHINVLSMCYPCTSWYLDRILKSILELFLKLLIEIYLAPWGWRLSVTRRSQGVGDVTSSHRFTDGRGCRRLAKAAVALGGEAQGCTVRLEEHMEWHVMLTEDIWGLWGLKIKHNGIG